ALGVVGGKIRCDWARVIEADHRAARRFRVHVGVGQSGTCGRRHAHAAAHKSLADDVARDDDVAEIFAPAGHDAERWGVLDYVASDRTVGLDIDADTGVVVRRGADRTLRP